ncbi:MAG: hypothetical protein ACD_2C00016G0021 [uncultured bacterium (gcode 4)]|uniref:Uncharacterized protein n=1 Tax=uncultured bacterium (gcode 4) TaxID=1234023 RepID=K2H337_9BACT|nr:MAG: hypothetical protein ACD_2C00016G0021 [uncultured bacterium (gcode 4)]
MDHQNITTVFELPNKTIVKNFGLVRWITVRSRSIFGTIGGALHTIVGWNITVFTNLCEQTRKESFELMVKHAEEMWANAIVGVHYDANEVMSSVTEVLCYGTAVLVQQKSE